MGAKGTRGERLGRVARRHDPSSHDRCGRAHEDGNFVAKSQRGSNHGRSVSANRCANGKDVAESALSILERVRNEIVRNFFVAFM